MRVPEQAEGWLNGSFVKIGVHGYVYLYHKGEWIKSSKNPVMVRGELNKKKNPWAMTE